MSDRPPKKTRQGTETRKKSIPVTSRYDEAEFKELDEASSRAGISRAAYQRVQSLAAPKTRSTRRAPVDRQALAKVLGLLGNVASNLNQVTRAANLGRAQLDRIDETVADIRGLLPLLLEALGRKP